MADPPPLDGGIRPPEPNALIEPALPPTQPLVDDGATAEGSAATPALRLGHPCHAPPDAIALNAVLADSQHDAARPLHQAALATANVELHAAHLQLAIVDAPPPDINDTGTDDALMNIGLEPHEGITLEQAVVDFPPPIHTPGKPWNRVPDGERVTFTVSYMSRTRL